MMLLCNPCPCRRLLMSLLLFLSENLSGRVKISAKLVTTKCNDQRSSDGDPSFLY